ncbi:hypothetical protein F4561_002996 [Lipingzhangella halophila]|uniref:Uncharacterized protein n=1 Tax=Lipingzhangella halophila TaxID=1783352 RepID=A0A7W7W2X5_9ACTN|nr:hypothetical protein [Lipingzhangella halophila]MBB4932176.1 hypothetical protein [Lipingzhangella halophila]
MGIQAWLPETSTGERVELGDPGRRNDSGEPPAREERSGSETGADQVSVIEVNASAPVWRWDVPGLAEPMPVA